MKTRIRFISCLLALVIITTGAAWAQDSNTTPTSPTNDATVGLTSTEIDQFVNVIDWGKVKFDKAFVFAGFAQGTKNMVDLGAAFKAGPLFIGSWYKGNLGVFDGDNKKKVQTKITQGATPGTIGNKELTTSGYDQELKKYDADHMAVMLFGFANMGIKTGYSRQGENYSGTFFDITDGGTKPEGFIKNDNTATESNKPEYLYSKVYSPNGYINGAIHRPFVDFGMNIPLGAMTLSPTASLEVKIYEGSIIKESGPTPYSYDTFYSFNTDTKQDSKEKYNITKTQQAKSNAHVGITGKLGTGLALGDSLNSVFNFGYDFTVNAYGKNYTAADGTKHKVIGNYNITTDTVEEDYNKATQGEHKITSTFKADFIKKSYFSNTLKAGYKVKKDFTDRLSLLAAAELPITLSFDNSVTEKIDTTITDMRYLNPSNAHNNNVKTETVTSPVKTVNEVKLNIAPSIKAAVSYAAKPGRLFLNLGADIKFLQGEFTSKKTSYDSFVENTKIVTKYNDGHTTTVTSAASAPQSESLDKTSSHKQIEAKLVGGIRWNIVENFAFDLVYSASLLDNSFLWVNFKDLKIACTIKF